ncbi:hypothetical protein HanXRQr2_Chr17g0825181 [Helianthus annuus]|uniref:Uncharacterized protein n=1 Tax=Helianthus annuus TaxID=4232 RepID=A0A9K3GVG6_HELAN|nr:hypothetical protein HanXRQr2_Chr17g0825181 [Helianthus annuus]
MLKFLQVQDSRVCCRLKLADSVMVGFDVSDCHSGGAMVVIVVVDDVLDFLGFDDVV